jgi:phosphatidate cytidylyltransferase
MATGLVTGFSMMSTIAAVLSDLVEPSLLFINIPLLFSIFIFELYRKTEKPFHNIAFTIFGVIYIVLPFALLMVIPFLSSGNPGYQAHLVFGYFLLLWASDTGAYLSGMAFGKRKLFERISPKKSWEGSIGGTLLNLFFAWCCSRWFPELDHLTWTIMGLLIVVTGTFGDLAESLLKRTLNIKDSGNILPGHGGLLDRFDALLVSVPFVLAFLALVR